MALKEWGIRQNEVQILLGGDGPTRLGSLMAGRIDAAASIVHDAAIT